MTGQGYHATSAQPAINLQADTPQKTGNLSEHDQSARESWKIRACAGHGEGPPSVPAGISTPSSSGKTRGTGPPHCIQKQL